jgi:uncharacterized protein YjdB
MKHSLILTACAVFAAVLSACGGDSTRPPGPPLELAVTPASLVLQVGETARIVAVVRNATTGGVTFASSNDAVASVSASGDVRGHAAGEATITVAAVQDASVRAEVPVRVEPPPPVAVTLSPSSATIRVGEHVDFVATVTNATNTAVRWESDAAEIVRVGEAGRATAVAPGTARIAAVSLADTTKRATAEVVVTLPPAQLRIAGVTRAGTGEAVAPERVDGEIEVSVEFVAAAARRLSLHAHHGEAATLVGERTLGADSAHLQRSHRFRLDTRSLPDGEYTLRAVLLSDSATAIREDRSDVLRFENQRAVASVRVTPADTALAVGESATLVATALDAAGAAVPGARILWRSSAPSVASVDSVGLVRALAAGSSRIAAVVAADTTIRAHAELTVGAAPRIGAITPALLTPGATATIDGSDFAPTADGNTVHIAGVRVAVTQASATRLTIRLPAATSFLCRPTGPAAVTVEVGDVTARRDHPLRVATEHALGIGESVSFLDAAAARCHEFAATGGRYVVNVFNASTIGSAIAPFQLFGASAAPGPSAAPPTRAHLHAPTTVPLSPELRARLAEEEEHHRLLGQSRQLVERLGMPRAAPQPMRDGPAAAARVPQVGETVAIRIPDITTSNICTNFHEITTRVVYSGRRGVILEDQASPLAGRMGAHHTAVGEEFDERMFDVLTTYFGDPLAYNDRLGNTGRITMVFSPVVNGTSALGFVYTGDFYPRTACEASNFGEYFYARVPTVDGTGFSGNTPDQWLRTMRSTIIHEVKHLTSFAERFSRATDFPRLEEVWLEESTARLSEEMWARTHFGYRQGENVGYDRSLYCEVRPTWAECAGRPYVMGKHFGGIYGYLTNVESFTPFGSFGGGGSSFYGSGWSLVRWAVDHSGMDEATFIRSLVQEGRLQGMGNLSAKTGKSIPRIIADWTAAVALDDYPDAALRRPELSIPSWNLRDVFAGLHGDFPSSYASAWPLAVRRLDFGGFSVAVPGVRAGTAATFEISGAQAGAQLLDLRGEDGRDPASTLGMTVTRVQ